MVRFKVIFSCFIGVVPAQLGTEVMAPEVDVLSLLVQTAHATLVYHVRTLLEGSDVVPVHQA